MEEKGSRKRKPLSDITNTYNLTPTPSLHNLVNATTNSSSHSKPRPSIRKPSSASSNQKLCSESSIRSDASIGSSSVGGAWSSRSVQIRTPPRAISSIGRTGDRRSKEALYNRKQKTEEITNERDAAVGVASPTIVEKRKAKGKPSAVPFGSSPPDTTKDTQNEFLDPSSLLEGEKQKGSAYRNLFDGLFETPQESNKSTIDSYNHPYGKTKRLKGSAYDSSFSLEKTVDGEKSGSSSDEKEEIFKQSGPSIVEIKEIGKQTVDPLDSLVERAKEKENPLNPVASSIERTRDKGKAIMQLPEVIGVTKSKGSSAVAKVNTRPPRRIDDGVSSCPPMTRIDLDEAGDLKSSKSWTDAPPKSKKKWSRSVNDTTALPLEFVEQQNEYFKEIDAFKLPEEEISEEELD